MKIHLCLSRIHIWIFLVILCIALGIRTWHLSSNPPALFCDEASIGYNAAMILSKGTDEYGIHVPLFFRAFGEFKNPLDIYTTIPFIALFGLTETGIRMTSVIFSLVNICLFFIIGKKTHSPFLGLFFGILFAVEPWSIHFSRINLEGLQIFLTCILLSLLAYITYISGKKFHYLLLTVLAIGIGCYTYFPARILMPLYLGGIILYICRQGKKYSVKYISLSFCLFFMLITPLGIHMSNQGLSRWNQVSIINNQTTPPVQKFITSYALHFSPDFLFFKGDSGMAGQFITRHSVKGIGQLYVWQSLCILIGLWYIWKIRSPLAFPTTLLLILYPIPSSLTSDLVPQASRSIAGLIPFTILTGYGILSFFNLIQKSRRAAVIFFVVCISILLASACFYMRLLAAYPLYAANYWGWQMGAKEMISYYVNHASFYDEFFMEGSFNSPDIFLKLYIPDEMMRSKAHIGGLEHVDKTRRQLFGVRRETYELMHLASTAHIKDIVIYPNSTPAFYLIEIRR